MGKVGLCNSPDIFQEKMNEIFVGFEYVRAYIDDLLIITKGDLEDHLEKVEQVLHKLQEKGLKVNANKCSFAQDKLEYLGYLITRKGIKPIAKKIEAMKRIKPPTNKKQNRSFIGMINYYRDMWKHRSVILEPLTALTSSKVKWKWTEIEQKAFDKMKDILSKEVMLSYPDFNKPFTIHTDASDKQIGAVISQNN